MQIYHDQTPDSSKSILEDLQQMANEPAENWLPVNFDYQAYLRGPLWRKIRRRVLKRDNHICVRCGGAAKEVHHLAYTDAVMDGEDDSLLASLCVDCHKAVEFDEAGRRRSSEEKDRVFEEREGPQRERLAAEESERLRNEAEEGLKVAARGRCYWCRGNTEINVCSARGCGCSIPTPQGEELTVWMCSTCRSTLDHEKDGSVRSDDGKIKLLEKQANVSYLRPTPATGFRFTNSYHRLNAMQQEGLMNEFRWNAANIAGLKKTNRKEFSERKARYEETQANGRDKRQR